MPKFKKKPVVIEAHQITDTASAVALAEWCGGYASWGGGTSSETVVNIKTLEGTMQALPGDWIIKGVAGEFYPCKPDIFAATYEEVDNG